MLEDVYWIGKDSINSSLIKKMIPNPKNILLNEIIGIWIFPANLFCYKHTFSL